MTGKMVIATLVLSLLTISANAQDNAIPMEAEDADRIGSDFIIVTEGDIIFLTPSTDSANSSYPIN